MSMKQTICGIIVLILLFFVAGCAENYTVISIVLTVITAIIAKIGCLDNVEGERNDR